MDGSFGEEEGYDTSDGADGEGYAVVSVEDDGDFFLSECWALPADLGDELFFGFAPFWLVLPESGSSGQRDAVFQVCDAFFVSVECCAGDVADFCAGAVIEAFAFELFPELDFFLHVLFSALLRLFLFGCGAGCCLDCFG